MDERTGFMLENKVYYEGKNKQSERKRRSSFWNLLFLMRSINMKTIRI